MSGESGDDWRGYGHARPLHDDLRYPGHHMPPRANEREAPLSPWGRMVMDQGLGKKVNLEYDAEEERLQLSPDSIFELRGLDMDACQMAVTLIGPSAIPRSQADLGIDLQNATGELDNMNVGAANYPGTIAPIRWPAFSGILKWGTGGARAQAVIDFVNGTVINLTASAVDLSAAVMPDAFSVPGTSGLYTLSGFISPGWTRPGNAQRTIYLGTIDEPNESSAVFATPPFARRATILTCDGSAGAPALTSAYLRYWRRPDGQDNVGNYFQTGNQPIAFDVPNAGMYFTVISGMTDPTLFAVCFELSI